MELTERLTEWARSIGFYVSSACLEKAIVARDWMAVFGCFDRPDEDHTPADAFDRIIDELAPELQDDEYVHLIVEYWVLHQGAIPATARSWFIDHGRSISRDRWQQLEGCPRLKKLSDPLTLYRGCFVGRESGWSWSTKRACALRHPQELVVGQVDKDFAKQVLLTDTVERSRVILKVRESEEEEVIVPGEHVNITKTEPRDELEDLID